MSTIEETDERSNISTLERRQPRTRVTFAIFNTVVITLLVLTCAGPLVVLGRWATSTTPDIVRDPLGFWPSGIHPENLPLAWDEVGVGRYLLNTLITVGGTVAVGLVMALTAAYVIAVLRPRWARVLNTAVLATLFIPGVISLIPLYLAIVRVPVIDQSLINTYWAVWLPPVGAQAFTILLVTRFFEQLPHDVFEAARMDGSGALRMFWSIVLPMSRPIIGVVVLMLAVTSWKDFLWPLLVLPDGTLQPVSVALPRIQLHIEVSLLMASLFIAVVIPVALFLVFQRQFLRSAGQSGAIKE